MPNNVRLLVRVRSMDPSITSARLFAAIQQRQGDLLTTDGDSQIEAATISRNLSFPVHGSDIAAEILLTLVAGVGEGIGKRIGEGVLEWLRENWPGADVEIIQLHISDTNSSPRKEG